MDLIVHFQYNEVQNWYYYGDGSVDEKNKKNRQGYLYFDSIFPQGVVNKKKWLCFFTLLDEYIHGIKTTSGSNSIVVTLNISSRKLQQNSGQEVGGKLNTKK